MKDLIKTHRRAAYFTCLTAVIVLSVLLAARHGCNKKYFYEDEVLSYTLANSRHGAYFNLQDGTWYSGADLYSWTYVEKGHGFDLAQTIENQKMDTNPPIYAILLHIASSLSAGDFSKWAGIGPNLACYIIVFILLAMTCNELFPDRPLWAVLICLIFGMTAGVVSLAVFIRMYMLLMIPTTACILWHIRAIRGNTSIYSWPSLVVVTYLGTMTHYFYLVFTFFCAIYLCIYRLLQRDRKTILKYIGSMAVSACLVLLTWSRAIWQLFSEDTAKDALSQDVTLSGTVAKIREMIRAIDSDIFGDRLKWVILAVGIYAIYLLVKDRRKLKNAFRPRIELAFISIVNILFILTISAITPYLNIRYISPAFPFIIILTVLTLEQVANAALRSPLLGSVLIALFIIWPEITILRGGLTDVNRQIIAKQASKHADDLCLFGSGIPPEENVFELGKYKNIYVYNGENADGAKDELGCADRVVVYVPRDTDPAEYTSDILSVNPRLTGMERLYVAYYSTCYLLYQEP